MENSDWGLQRNALKRAAVRVTMPILSMFYGIVVRMYVFDNKRHHLAHVHADILGMKRYLR